MEKNNSINYSTIRDKTLLNELVIVDGQPGCGKTLLSAILASMPRVELLQYSPLLENICALHHLNKITKDAALTMLQIEFDLILYETMMSRNTNFRPTDLSSAYRDVKFFTYLKRLFEKGDEEVPEKILSKKPILHFATHNLLGFSDLLMQKVVKKLLIIEVVRHPLYMIMQQTLNHENWVKGNSTARQFHLYINKDGKNVPYYINEWDIDFTNLNPAEKAIYEMSYMFEKTELFKSKFPYNNIVTIPFESFVLDPLPFVNKINNKLDIVLTNTTKKIMKKQKVPRKRISDGIPLDIYKRCGWEPPDKTLSEKEELDKRKRFVLSAGANKQSLEVLDKMIEDYENKYFSFKGD